MQACKKSSEEMLEAGASNGAATQDVPRMRGSRFWSRSGYTVNFERLYTGQTSSPGELQV